MNLRLLAALVFALSGTVPARQSLLPSPVSTPAITLTAAAWDSASGDLGIAVQSQLIACGAIIPSARAGVGVTAVQGMPGPNFGLEVLRLLEGGTPLQEALDSSSVRDANSPARNIGAMNVQGTAIVMTGNRARSTTSAGAGKGYFVLADGFAGTDVVGAMTSALLNKQGSLPEKLIAALDAGMRIVGTAVRFRSASLLVVRKNGGYYGEGDRLVDIRVDADSLPLIRLRHNFSSWEAEYLQDAEWRLVEQLNGDRKFDDAREMLKRIIAGLNEELRKRPDDPKTLCHIARELALHDIDRDRALELILRADKISPARPDVMDTMGECYYRLGRFDEAIAVASRLVALDPANEYYQNQLQKFRAGKQR
jgi:uncharacterized Ntn-hydrolase superfamily protein